MSATSKKAPAKRSGAKAVGDPGTPPRAGGSASGTKKAPTAKKAANSRTPGANGTAKTASKGAKSPATKKKSAPKKDKSDSKAHNGRPNTDSPSSALPGLSDASPKGSRTASPSISRHESGTGTPLGNSAVSLRQGLEGDPGGAEETGAAAGRPDEPNQMNEGVLRVLQGRLDHLPTMNSKIVRIFTSSTFTDTSFERNKLMQQIYPKLKEYCRGKHGFEFQVVDMRWGVRDEATDDHMTSYLCLKELENCQRLSVGPSFVVFLGQKYGFRPIPTFIEAKEFELIRAVVKATSMSDYELLTTWYQRDDNMVPAMNVLQPISSILVNFNNKRMQRLMEQDQNLWWEIMMRMQRLLRKATAKLHEEGALNDEQKHNYFMSVTEREVIHGILRAREPTLHTHCYLRTLEELNTNIVRVARNFMDFNGLKVDEEAQKLLNLVKDTKLPAVLPECSITRLSIKWSDEGGTNPDDEEHHKYVENFCSHFYDTIVTLIEKGVERLEELSGDQNFTEILQHLHACRNHCKVFQGREDLIERIKAYVLDSLNDRALVIFGESGCGKTSLLAKAASQVRSWLGPRVNTVIRFLGTSPDSSTLSPLLTSLCMQIAQLYGEPVADIPSELPKLVRHLKTLFGCATKERPLVLFLDSMDQLSEVDGAHALVWLPDRLPKHVRLLVSTLPGYYGLLETLEAKVERERNFIKITPLGEDLSASILKSWLKSAQRTIAPSQWEVVHKALAKCNLPLFVKLVFDEICRWRSYHSPASTSLAFTIQDSIHNLFQRIENQHGKILVTHAFSYITASKSGLSEAELEDILSLDDKVLNDVYQYHVPPTRRIPPLLWTRIRNDLPGYLNEREADGVNVINWYHRQFIDVARARYFKNLNFKEDIHHTLSDFYLGKWSGVPKPFEYDAIHLSRRLVTDRRSEADRRVASQPFYFKREDGASVVRHNLRKLSELPFNLLRANRFDDLFKDCLFNFEFLHAKLSCMPLNLLLKDLQELLAKKWDRDTKILLDTLRLSASVITRWPDMLGPQIAGRLLPYYGSHARIRALIEQCDGVGLESNALMPAFHCLHTPGGPLEYSLEGHLFAPYGVRVTEDGLTLVSVTNQLIVWDVSTGDTLRMQQLEGLKGIMQTLLLGPDSKMAIAYTNTNQIVKCQVDSGESRICSSPFSATDGDITGAEIAGEVLVLWTCCAWLFTDLNDNVLGKGRLPADCRRELMKVEFASAQDFWLVLRHLDVSSEEEDEMSLAFRGHIPTAFEFHNALVLNFNKAAMYACIAISDHDVAIYDWPKEEKEEERGGAKAKEQKEEKEWNYQKSIDNQDRLFALTLSHDETILVGTVQSGFKLWKLKKRDVCMKLNLPTGVRNIPSKNPFSSLICFSRTREYMIAAVRSKIFVYSTFSGSLAKTFDAHFGRIVSLLAVHKTNRLVSGSMDKSIKVWNLDNIMERVFPIDRMDKAIEAISLAAHCNLAATRTRNAVGIWNLNSGLLLRTLTSGSAAILRDLFLSADGSVVVSLEAGSVILWSVETGAQLCAQPHSGPGLALIGQPDALRCLVFFRPEEGGPGVRCVSRSLSGDSFEKAIFCFDFAAPKFLRPAVTSDGKLLVVPAGDALLLHNAQTGAAAGQVPLKGGAKFCRILPMPAEPSQVVLVHPETEEGGSAVLWDVRKKAAVRSFGRWNGESTRSGKFGLHAPTRGGLELVSLRKGARSKVLIPKIAEGVFQNTCFFTSTDAHVAYYHSGHRELRVFRVSDGRRVGAFRVHAALGALASSPGGFSLILGGEDGSLNAVTIADPQFPASVALLRELASRNPEPCGDSGPEAPQGPSAEAGAAAGGQRSVAIGASLRIAQMVARKRINKVQNSQACAVS